MKIKITVTNEIDKIGAEYMASKEVDIEFDNDEFAKKYICMTIDGEKYVIELQALQAVINAFTIGLSGLEKYNGGKLMKVYNYEK